MMNGGALHSLNQLEQHHRRQPCKKTVDISLTFTLHDLPNDVNLDSLKASIAPSGVLTINWTDWPRGEAIPLTSTLPALEHSDLRQLTECVIDDSVIDDD